MRRKQQELLRAPTQMVPDRLSSRDPRDGDPAGAETATLPLVPFGIGIWELLILLLVLLLVFGPKRLPEMGRQLGKGMREFKDSVSGNKDDHDDDADEPSPSCPPPSPATTTATPRRASATPSPKTPSARWPAGGSCRGA